MARAAEKSYTENSLYEVFEHVEEQAEFRDKRGKRHSMFVVLLLYLMGQIMGFLSFRSIHRNFSDPKVKTKIECHLPIKHGIPSYTTFSRVISKIPQETLLSDVCDWIYQLLPDDEDGQPHYGIDGKALRAAVNKAVNGSGLYMVNIYNVVINIFVYMIRVGKKTNERAVIEANIRDIIHGEKCLITMDAMGTGVNMLDLICSEGSDAVLPVKQNQKTLSRLIAEYMIKCILQNAENVEHYVDLNDYSENDKPSRVISNTRCSVVLDDNPQNGPYTSESDTVQDAGPCQDDDEIVQTQTDTQGLELDEKIDDSIVIDDEETNENTNDEETKSVDEQDLDEKPFEDNIIVDNEEMRPCTDNNAVDLESVPETIVDVEPKKGEVTPAFGPQNGVNTAQQSNDHLGPEDVIEKDAPKEQEAIGAVLGTIVPTNADTIPITEFHFFDPLYHYYDGLLGDIPLDKKNTRLVYVKVGNRYIPMVSGHGRFERREYEYIPLSDDLRNIIFDDIAEDWHNVKGIGLVTRYRATLTRDRETKESYYNVTISRTPYILSYESNVEDFANTVRSHWAIECPFHNATDVILGEDKCTVRKLDGPENVSLLKKLAYNVLRIFQERGFHDVESDDKLPLKGVQEKLSNRICEVLNFLKKRTRSPFRA